MVSGELLFNCKSLTRCVGVNYADISRGYFSSVLFSPGKKHFIRGCRNQNTTLHILTLSHMCFHKRKHFSLATSPLVPKDFRGARWARKIICSLLFWWGLEIRPLNPSLTHRSFSLPAEGGIRCFPPVSPCPSGHNWSNSGTTEPGKATPTDRVWSHGTTPLLIFCHPTREGYFGIRIWGWIWSWLPMFCFGQQEHCNALHWDPAMCIEFRLPKAAINK